MHAADWTAARTELTRSCLGPERRAGTSSAYAEPRRRYVGYLRSTSPAKPGLFAVRHARFKEKALRLLAEHAHGGVLREEAVFTVLLARRPGGER